MDPTVEAALTVAKAGHQSLREALQRAPRPALDWQPAPDTNSICVLVHHALNSEKWWLAQTVGEELPRNRDAEFLLRDQGAADLLRRIDQADADANAYLSRLKPEDFTRQITYRDQRVSAAWAVIHALEHVREHVGHVELTLQLWERRAAS